MHTSSITAGKPVTDTIIKVYVLNINSNSIKLNWTKHPAIKKYRVSLYSKNQFVKALITSKNTLEINDLQGGTLYQWVLSDEYGSKESLTGRFTTEENNGPEGSLSIRDNESGGSCDKKYWVIDQDNDGYFLGDIVYYQCNGPTAAYVEMGNRQEGDCDDTNPNITAGTTWVMDADGDSYYFGDPVSECYNNSPGEGYVIKTNQIAGDCDDTNPTITLGTLSTWVLDADNDGYYIGDPVTSCTTPGTGYVIKTNQIAVDCNDNDASVNAGATEIFDEKDNNCNGAIDEGFPPVLLSSNNLNSPGFKDYTIPFGISSLAVNVKGANGGSFTAQNQFPNGSYSNPSVLAAGGRGQTLNTTFNVKTDCQEGLEPGGTLRLIIGETPETYNYKLDLLGPAPQALSQGGGGGSALLYKAPGSNNWVVLVVAGGGGGAATTINNGSLSGITGGNASSSTSTATTGQAGSGGKGIYYLEKIVVGREVTINEINISGGGGGSTGDAINSCGGGKGLDAAADGGVSNTCTGALAGGFGFGAGGSGKTSGGGGGGYSGGNGGGTVDIQLENQTSTTGGYGAGSFAGADAINPTWQLGNSAQNGAISITANSFTGSCCSAITLTSSTLVPLAISGCGTEEVANETFAYSTTLVSLTSQQYTSLNFAIAAGSCDLASVSYKDEIDVALSSSGKTVINRTFTLTDVNGQSVTATQVITVTDNQKPVIAPVTDIDVSTDPDKCSAVVSVTAPAASDNCNGGTATGTRSDNKPLSDPYPKGTTTITWSYSDGINNADEVIQKIIVADNQKPVIAPVTDINVSTDQDKCSAVVSVTATFATDNCNSGTASGTRSDNKPLSDPYPKGTTTITWNFSDGVNNADPVIQKVTVTDNQKPVIAPVTDINVSTDQDKCSAVVSVAAPAAADNCNSGTATGTRSDNKPLSDPYPKGTTTITWNYSDGANFADQVLQKVIVADNQKPVIAPVTDINVSTDQDKCTATVSITTPAAADNCNSGTATGTRSDNKPLSDPYPKGTTTITWSYSDGINNADEVIQKIIVADNQKPVIAPVTDINVSTDPDKCSAVVSVTAPAAADNCNSGTATGTRSDNKPLTDPYPKGTTTITWNFSDGLNNADPVIQKVTVTDSQKPVIAPVTDINVSTDPDKCTAIVSVTAPAAADNCNSGTATGTRSDNKPLSDPYPKGTTTITWNYSDGANFADQVLQKVIVADNQKPVIAPVTDIDVSTDPDKCTAIVSVTAPAATDNCNSGIATGTRSDNKPLSDPYPKGTTTITWNYSDGVNNADPVIQKVTVTDNQKPVITLPAIQSAYATDAGDCTRKLSLTATATDNCSISSIKYYKGNTEISFPYNFEFGVTTVTVKATDVNGNISESPFNVNVNKITTITTLTVSPSTQQYSDRITFTATIQPANCTGAGDAGGTVTFRIGTQVMGTQPVINGVATLSNVALLETPTTLGLLAPGNKSVSASFAGTDADYSVENPVAVNLTVTREDACLEYNGQPIFGAQLQGQNFRAIVSLSAIVTDAADGNNGDIRNARVNFTTNSIGSFNNVEVGLLNPANTTLGQALVNNISVPLTNADVNNGGRTVEVTMSMTNGYYQIQSGNCSNDIMQVITIGIPGTDNVTGGGYILLPTGTSGIFAGLPGSKTNFGFNMKWNKSGKNLQGGINIIYRLPNGRVYQIKSNAINSLTVNGGIGTVNTKAELIDITNPLAPQVILGNNDLIVVAVDDNTNGDRFSFRLVNPSTRTGMLNGQSVSIPAGLLVTNNLASNGTTTTSALWKGQINVRTGTMPSLRTNETITPPLISQASNFNVKVLGNPSTTKFTLKVESSNFNEKITLKIVDVSGRIVEVKQNVYAGQVIEFGADYKVGSYFVEAVQGVERKVIKLIKAERQ